MDQSQVKSDRRNAAHPIRRSSLSRNRTSSLAHSRNCDENRAITPHGKLAVHRTHWNSAHDVRAGPAAPCGAAAAVLQCTRLWSEQAAAPGRLACNWQSALVTNLGGRGVRGRSSSNERTHEERKWRGRLYKYSRLAKLCARRLQADPGAGVALVEVVGGFNQTRGNASGVSEAAVGVKSGGKISARKD